jgi:hypothetical protein
MIIYYLPRGCTLIRVTHLATSHTGGLLSCHTDCVPEFINHTLLASSPNTHARMLICTILAKHTHLCAPHAGIVCTYHRAPSCSLIESTGQQAPFTWSPWTNRIYACALVVRASSARTPAPVAHMGAMPPRMSPVSRKRRRGRRMRSRRQEEEQTPRRGSRKQWGRCNTRSTFETSKWTFAACGWRQMKHLKHAFETLCKKYLKTFVNIYNIQLKYL